LVFLDQVAVVAVELGIIPLAALHLTLALAVEGV
jgi:hypothetical protein